MATEAFEYMAEILDKEWVERSLDEYNEFRVAWSPEGRWSHRPPQVSPIVPLLYWNSMADFDEVVGPVRPYEPMGFWAGHPKEILDRMTEELQHFEAYWREIPGDRGKANLAWALKKPQRFFSLAHELATAFFLDARPGVSVQPHFLDPKSSSGKPDILVHTTDRDFAVQCKSQDPTSARSFPFDLWQYFAGVFHRAVQDSGRSTHLNVVLDRKVEQKQMTKVAKRISNLVRRGVSTPYPVKAAWGSFQLTDMGEYPHVEDLVRLKLSAFVQAEPLYDELVALPSLVEGRYRCASLAVAGARGDDLSEVVRKAVTAATKAARTTEPLIVAVHVYHEVDLSEFSDRPLVQNNLIPWSDRYFADNPRLALVFLSSNFERYGLRLVGDDKVGIGHGRVGWVLESPVWDHAEVEALGI